MSEFESTFYLLKATYWAKPWWVEDNGEYWINYRGSLVPKHKDDEVLDICVVENITDLDWSVTGLIEDQTNCGWLSREGKWYGCSHMGHRMVAQWVLNSTEKKLGQSGWIRVWHKDDWGCELRGITESQRSWLENHGHEVDETEWGRL